MRVIWSQLNPLRWPKRTIKICLTAFYLIALPLYIFFGLQPATAVESITAQLSIPSIALSTPVTALEPTGRTLPTPDYIAGSYQQNPNKTLLIGHSSTVFHNLSSVQPGDIINYQDQIFQVSHLTTLEKSRISMASLLAATDSPTLILMTCAGQALGGQDYTHRLIITASLLENPL